MKQRFIQFLESKNMLQEFTSNFNDNFKDNLSLEEYLNRNDPLEYILGAFPWSYYSSQSTDFSSLNRDWIKIIISERKEYRNESVIFPQSVHNISTEYY